MAGSANQPAGVARHRVIVASVAGLRGAGDEAVYAATKFAQVGLAGGLDRELHREGIRTTVIAPGGVATEFAMGAGRTPDMPGLANMLRPEDVAAAIVMVLDPRVVDAPRQRGRLSQRSAHLGRSIRIGPRRANLGAVVDTPAGCVRFPRAGGSRCAWRSRRRPRR